MKAWTFSLARRRTEYFSFQRALLITLVGNDRLHQGYDPAAARQMATFNALPISPETYLAGALTPSAAKRPKERGPEEYGCPKTRSTRQGGQHGQQGQSDSRGSGSSPGYGLTSRYAMPPQAADHRVQGPSSGPRELEDLPYSVKLGNGWTWNGTG